MTTARVGRGCAIAALAVCLLAGSARAADRPFSLRSTAGTLGNYVSQGNWSQVILRLDNPLAEEQVATVTCVVRTAGGADTHFSRVVRVPAESERQARLAIRLPVPPADAAAGRTRQGRTERRAAKILPETELPILLDTRSGRVKRPYLAQTLEPDMLPVAVVGGRNAEPHDTDSYLSKEQHSFGLGLTFLDASGREIAAAAPIPNLTENAPWQTVTVTREVPPGARRLRITAGFDRALGTGDVDDVRVVPDDSGENVFPAGSFEESDSAGRPLGWEMGEHRLAREGRNRFARIDRRRTEQSPGISATVEVSPTWREVRISARLQVKKLRAGQGSEPLASARRLAGVIRANLPDRWYGYSALRLLILKASAAVDLRHSQVDAVLGWVARGGVLVVTGGSDMPEVLRSRLGEAAGAVALGVHRVGSLAAEEVLDDGELRPAGALDLRWPMPMVELCPTSATVRYRANGLPLLTSRACGRGRIFVLAVPTGALHGPAPGGNLHRVWQQLWPPHIVTQEPAIDADRFMQLLPAEELRPAERTLQSIAGRRGPPPAVPVIITVALLLLTIAAGAVLRFRRRSELVWAGLLPLAAIIAVGLYLYGRAQVAPEQVSTIALVSPLADGEVRLQQVSAYYSGEDTRELSFSAGGGRAVIRPLQLATAARGRDDVRIDGTMSIHSRTVHTASSAGFYVDGVTRTDIVGGRLTFDERGLAGVLENSLPEPITNAVVLAGGRTYRLGDAGGGNSGAIPAGGTKQITVGPDQLLGRVSFVAVSPAETAEDAAAKAEKGAAKGRPGRDTRRPRLPRRPAAKQWVAGGEFTGSRVFTRTDNLRNALLGRMMPQPGFRTPLVRAPVLVGYTSALLADPLPGRQLTRRGWTVVVWPLEVGPPPPGQAGRPVAIPEGFVDLAYHPRPAGIWNVTRKRFEPTTYDTELVVTASPPAAFGAITEAEARVTVSIRANGYRLTVGGVTGGDVKSGERVAARRAFEDPRLVGEVVTVERADRFRRADGTYVLSLNVERTAAEEEGEEASGLANRIPWSFESVEVGLKGRAK
jgi:hypothetical protein